MRVLFRPFLTGIKLVFILMTTFSVAAVHATSLRPADQVTILSRTIYNDGNLALPDSVKIQVFRNGSGLFNSWYNIGDAEADSADGWLVFTDQLQDIDGAGGDGHYIILGRAYDADSTLYTPWIYSFDVGQFTTIEDIKDSVYAVVDSLQEQSGWVAREATVNGLNDFDPLTDSVILDMSALDAASRGSAVGRGWLSLAPHFGWVAARIDTTSFKIAGPMTSYGDDFFNQLRLIFIDGSLIGRSSTVIDWNSVDSTITVNPLPEQPAVNDTFAVLPNLDPASAGVPDSLTSRVDSILASLGAYSDTSVTAKLGAYSGLAGDDNNVKDDIAAVSTQGGGTEPETLFVFASDTTALEGVSVTVRNMAQTATKVPGKRTDSSGRVILELDPDSFVVALYANNYTQGDLDTIAVNSGGGTDTLWINMFDPGNPADPDLCRVYGWVYDITGDPLEGVSVTAEIPPEYHPVKYSDIIITPFRKSVETDSLGYWQIDLFPNSLLSAPDSKYLFAVEYPSGVIFRSTVEVPDSVSWQLR
jgi:hypothetical protein